MSDLRMTSGRLNLLRAVRDGLVWRQREIGEGPQWTIRRPGERWRRVTAKADELYGAGLIASGRADGPSAFARRPVRLTAAGEAILASEDQEASR